MKRALIAATVGVVGTIPLQVLGSAYSNAVTALGPDAYWRMQETSGLGTDQVGNTYPLANFLNVTRGTAGPSLPGMETNQLAYGFSTSNGFTGANTNNTPYVPVSGTGARTEILWAEETTDVASLGGAQNLTEYGANLAGSNTYTTFSLNFDFGYNAVTGQPLGYDTFELNDEGREVQGQTTPIIPGTWYMLAVVYPSTGTTLGDAQLYVNGVQQSLINDTGATINTAPPPTSNDLPFRVGQGYGGYGLNGNETELSFFKSALSSGQIQGLYDTAEGIVPSTALSWNNTGASAPSDGVTWDTTNNNWNNGTSAATYSDGSAVTFNDTNNGHYSVSLNTTVSPGSVTVNNSAGTYTISGSGHIAGTASLTKSGSGTLVLSTANSYSGGTTLNAGTLVARVSGAVPTAGPINVSGGTLQLGTGTGLFEVQMSSLTVSGNATLDITNNHVILNYGSGPDPINSIAGLIQSGFAGGSWTGTGITSSTAQTNGGSYGIGYADSADAGNPAGLSSGQIEVMYTLLGDANLDGKVNGTDFTLMATHFNDSVTNGWDEGDFNYSGTVNGSDFLLLASNFNQFASQSAVSAADAAALNAFAAANGISLSVPEPASFGLLGLGVAGLLHRRKKALR